MWEETNHRHEWNRGMRRMRERKAEGKIRIRIYRYR
jgi:hypothetical protein